MTNTINRRNILYNPNTDDERGRLKLGKRNFEVLEINHLRLRDLKGEVDHRFSLTPIHSDNESIDNLMQRMIPYATIDIELITKKRFNQYFPRDS